MQQPERVPKVPVQVSFPEEMMDRAREEALKEGRTLSNWIERLIAAEIQQESKVISSTN